MVQKTLANFGRVDILVNNAGVGSYRTLMESTIKEWDLVMDINLRAPFICCKAVVPSMMEQGGGSIINLSSHASTHIFSSTVEADREADIALLGQAYGSAKAALERFSWGLAAELGRYNIAVNVLKPLRPTPNGFPVKALKNRVYFPRRKRTMKNLISKFTNRSSPLFRDQRGITGSRETAIVLIAFVVVSSVFAFAALSTGLFTTDKAKETIHAGLSEARGTMELKGPVIADATAAGTAGVVEEIVFHVSNAAAGEAIDLSQRNTIIRYTDKSQTANLNTDTEFSLSDNGAQGARSLPTLP